MHSALAEPKKPAAAAIAADRPSAPAISAARLTIVTSIPCCSYRRSRRAQCTDRIIRARGALPLHPRLGRARDTPHLHSPLVRARGAPHLHPRLLRARDAPPLHSWLIRARGAVRICTRDSAEHGVALHICGCGSGQSTRRSASAAAAHQSARGTSHHCSQKNKRGTLPITLPTWALDVGSSLLAL